MYVLICDTFCLTCPVVFSYMNFVTLPLFVVVKALTSLCWSCFTYTSLNKYSVSVNKIFFICTDYEYVNTFINGCIWVRTSKINR